MAVILGLFSIKPPSIKKSSSILGSKIKRSSRRGSRDLDLICRFD